MYGRAAMPSKLLKVFDANLRSAAASQGYTLEVVARRSRISLDLLLKVLSGEHDADIDLLDQIANGVGVRLGSLLTDPDEDGGRLN